MTMYVRKISEVIKKFINKFIHKNSLNDNVCAKIPLSP